MIAYRALKPIPTSSGGEDEMMVPDPIHQVDDRLTDRAAVVATAPTRSQGGRPLISIIDSAPSAATASLGHSTR